MTTETISAETAERLRAQLRDARFGRHDTFEVRLRDEALAQFRDSEEGHSSPYADHIESFAPAAAGVYGQNLFEEFEKVSYAYIVPIADEASVTTVTRKVKLTVPGDLADALRGPGQWEAMRKVRALLESDLPKRVLGEVTVAALPTARKPQAKATEGKAVTKYKIVPSVKFYSYDSDVRAVLNAEYDSQAEARSAAIDLMVADESVPALTVTAVVCRVLDDGASSRALVEITRPVSEQATITLNVTTHTVKPNPVIKEYKVSFWYHL